MVAGAKVVDPGNVASVLKGGVLVPVPPPSGDTTGATDTAVIQALENTWAGTGAIITFASAPASAPYYVTGLIKKSGTIWQGSGREGCQIKLASGANADVIQGYQFSTLTGGGSQNGISGFAINDMTIDGNGSNQTGTSFGGRWYGYDFTLQNVTFTNAFSDGLWTEWAYGGTFAYGNKTSSLESNYIGVKCCFNGGWGHHNRGPHDSTAFGCIWFDNNQAYSATPSSSIAAGSNGGTLSNIATWGATYGGNGVLVASTTGFPAAGTITVATSSGTAAIAYTGTTATSFTGCTFLGGAISTTVATGSAITQANQGNLWCQDDPTGANFLAGGFQAIACHSWGSSAGWGIISDSFLIWSGGEIEGGTFGALLVRGNLDMSATRVYYLTPLAAFVGAGVQLGDDGSTVGALCSFPYTSSQVRIAATGIDNFAGAGRNSAPLGWVSCNTSDVSISCKMPLVTVASGSNGQGISTLTGSQLFVSSTAGYPGTGSVYVQTSGGFGLVSYTSITAGATPSFNGVTYVSGPGGTVATGNTVSGDPLGATTPDIYSTLHTDSGVGGNSGIRGVTSRQQVPGITTHRLGSNANAFSLQGPTSNIWANLNASTISSPFFEFVGLPVNGWTAGYGKKTLSVDGTVGSIQPGTAANGLGSHIYSGTGAPSTSVPVASPTAGDIYIRTDTPSTANQRIYVCTTGGSSSVWSGIV